MSAPNVTPVEVIEITRSGNSKKDDLVTVEEPLEIRLQYFETSELKEKSISVTMRTPGNDLELALGFLFTENVISAYKQVDKIFHCKNVKSEEEQGNVVIVKLVKEVEVDIKKLQRFFYTSSSCGVCGKTSIDAITAGNCQLLPADSIKVTPNQIYALPEKLHDAQTTFKHTGGLHAAALFDEKGKLVLVREDVGRHNALDKLIGSVLHEAMMPLTKNILLLSGRISFELVQKAVATGVTILAAVGAPSSLAIQLAEEFNLTLIGFVKENRFNIYCGGERVVED